MAINQYRAFLSRIFYNCTKHSRLYFSNNIKGKWKFQDKNGRRCVHYTSPKAHAEVTQYSNMPSTQENPLQWWKSNAFRFLLFTHEVTKYLYLAIPATSIPSETAFRAAGHIVNAKRACLLPNSKGNHCPRYNEYIAVSWNFESMIRAQWLHIEISVRDLKCFKSRLSVIWISTAPSALWFEKWGCTAWKVGDIRNFESQPLP